MGAWLTVPIRVDALVVSSTAGDAMRPFVGPMADFKALAYPASDHNANADVAYLSENIVNQPMTDATHQLGDGIHLHWALPDALTTSHPVEEGTDQISMPQVPTCWLVTRSSRAGRRRWVVESDYVWPISDDHEEAEKLGLEAMAQGSLPYPNFPIETAKETGKPPFRYLGRTTIFENWSDDSSDGNRLNSLTAFGYGEPAFAAFYPNCRNVFGMRDTDPPADGEDVSYSVIGWYRHAGDDPCHNSPGPPTLFERYHWQLPKKSKARPSRVLLAGDVGLRIGAVAPNPSFNAPVEVAIGATGTEALSALLAKKDVASASRTGAAPPKEIIEEQLEALHLADDLIHRDVDLGAKFKEARHTKGFHAVSGGSIWAIRAIKQHGSKADASHAQPNMATSSETDAAFDNPASPLPVGLAHQLNQLNITQQALDRLQSEIDDRRMRLFADWYHYMLVAYPGDNRYVGLLDIDKVKDFIERHDLAPLHRAEQDLGGLGLKRDRQLGVLQKALDDGQRFVQEDVSDWRALKNQVLGDDHYALQPLKNAMVVLPDNPRDDQKRDVINALNALLNSKDLPYSPITGSWPSEAASILEVRRRVTNRIVLQTVIPALGPRQSFQTMLDEAKPFTSADLSSWQAFYAQVTGRKETLLEPLKTIIAGASQNRELKDRVVSELNRLMQSQDLYRSLDFSAPQAIAINNVLKGYKCRVNRLIIQAAFPALRKRAPLALQEMPAPRFFEPKEPVVLMHGDAVEATDRHGRTQPLPCAILKLAKSPTDLLAERRIEAITALEDQLFGPTSILDKVARRTMKQQPWNPILLDWEVEFRTDLQGEPGLDYGSSCLQDGYELDQTSADLSKKNGPANPGPRCAYLGRCLLSPHAKPMLIKRIEAFLDARLTEPHFRAIHPKKTDSEPEAGYFEKNRDAIIDWYLNASADGLNLAQPMLVADMVEIWRKVSDWQRDEPTFHLLSQALSGFHAGLLGQRLTMQLPVDDPLALPTAPWLPAAHDADGQSVRTSNYQEFAAAVRDMVGRFNRLAPVLLDEFEPLRMGTLEIRRLRLIDTFGQWRDIEPETLTTSEPMAISDNTESNTSKTDLPLARLRPRFACPARLDLRWIAADLDEIEMNTHPASSPICGWLLTNDLDRSLWVYANDGAALGYLNDKAEWVAAPVSRAAVDHVAQMPNRHARDVTGWLGAKRDRLTTFIDTVESACSRILPSAIEHHAHTSLMIGQPLAIVRARMALRGHGLTPIDHGSHAFQQDLQGTPRRSRGLEHITIPVRLGDHGQLEDGLVGYWLQKEGHDEAEFCSPLPDETEAGLAIRTGRNCPRVNLSMASAPQDITMLMDPRGKVHATTGVLPVKIIDIPGDQFAASLRAIEIGFEMNAVLTPERQDYGSAIHVPVPQEDGFEWHWADLDREGVVGSVDTPDTNASFRHPNELRDGWLTLQHQKAPSDDDAKTGGPL